MTKGQKQERTNDIFDRTRIKKGFDEKALVSVNKYLDRIFKYMGRQFISQTQKRPSKLKAILDDRRTKTIGQAKAVGR